MATKSQRRTASRRGGPRTQMRLMAQAPMGRRSTDTCKAEVQFLLAVRTRYSARSMRLLFLIRLVDLGEELDEFVGQGFANDAFKQPSKFTADSALPRANRAKLLALPLPIFGHLRLYLVFSFSAASSGSRKSVSRSTFLSVTSASSAMKSTTLSSNIGARISAIACGLEA